MTALRPPLTGVARVDRRTKNLIPRLRQGEIALIDHRDLDGLAGSGLVERRPAAVVNASPSISGRYPNRGPSLLLAAGIPLLDLEQDSGAMTVVSDGERVQLDESGLRCGEERFPGSWWTAARVESALEDARAALGSEIEAFAKNTLQYIERERHLVVDTLEMPEIRTALARRHAVVVVRGEGYKQDLEALLPYLREVRPVLIAVDGGADALLEFGLKPHVIVGDMDSVSDSALRSGAEIIVHSYSPGRAGPVDPLPHPSEGAAGTLPSANGSARAAAFEPAANHQAALDHSPAAGREFDGDDGPAAAEHPGRSGDPADGSAAGSAPGLARLQQLGIPGQVFSVAGTSEDMAMLLAYEKGAELIVTVGTHFGLVDFLEKGRAGMSSTFLVRLRVASRLVDARGVSALYGASPGLGFGAYLIAAAAVPAVIVAALSPAMRASLSLSYILFTTWLKKHGL